MELAVSARSVSTLLVGPAHEQTVDEVHLVCRALLIVALHAIFAMLVD